MTVKLRSPGQVGISLSMSEKLRDAIDARAHDLGLTRSQYLGQLARQDIAAGGSLVINSSSVDKLADASISAAAPAVPATPVARPVSFRSTRAKPRRSKAPPAPGAEQKAP